VDLSGEQIGRIESNCNNLTKAVDRIEGKLDRVLEAQADQAKVIARHGFYLEVAAWGLGIVTVVVTTWATGLGELIFRRAAGAIGG